jgi:hypothetical protein
MDAIFSEEIIKRFDLRFDRKGRLLPSGPSKAALYVELQELRDDLWIEMRKLRAELVNDYDRARSDGRRGPEATWDVCRDQPADEIQADAIETRRCLRSLVDGLRAEIREASKGFLARNALLAESGSETAVTASRRGTRSR